MRTEGRTRSRKDLVLSAVGGLALALIIILFPTKVAQAHCAAGDSDGDGFINETECHDITFAGTQPAAGTFPTCVGRTFTATFTRNDCVDPNSKDLFVILVKATPSSNFDLLTDLRNNILLLFDFISKPISQGGLGYTIHLITADKVDSSNRVCLSECPHAVKVIESLDLNGTTTGYADQPTDSVFVYTGRIRKTIVDAWASVLVAEANIPASDFLTYYRETTAQEIAHHLGLRATCTITYGCHTAPGKGFVVDYQVTFTARSGSVTWKFGTVFEAADQGAASFVQ